MTEMNDTMKGGTCDGKASILFVLFILSFFSFSFVYDGIRGGSLADKPYEASALFHIYSSTSCFHHCLQTTYYYYYMYEYYNLAIQEHLNFISKKCFVT